MDDGTADLPAARAQALRVVLMFGETVRVLRLPSKGEIIFGRDRVADVPIADPSVSRQHARLTLGGPESFLLEDLGSANGTHLGGRRLLGGERAPLQTGMAFRIGAITAVLHRGGTTARPRRISTHDYFEQRLEEECERARRTQRGFTVVRLQLGDEASAQRAEFVLAEVLRSYDVIGIYAPQEIELLLVETTADQGRQIVEKLARELSSAEGGEPKAGVASFPADGTTPETLAARANARMRGVKHESHPPPRPTGTSPAMKKLDLLVERLAPSNISVLILGETGTGKEVLADRVHERSPRGHRPLLKINCAALSESLLESELFGFERGAFTGADQAKPGLLETVDGGTVFLDEVGELPPSLQAKLLRVIESRQVMRVGGLQPRPIDVRFLSATNRDLELETSRGRFRADLYFRLNGASLVLPPLRDRRDEILPLARFFAERCAQDYGARCPPQITAEAAEAFERYAWPGNIRELRNVVERAVLLAGDDPVALEHLPLEKLGTTLITRDQLDVESLGGEESFELEPISASMTEVRTTPMVPPLLRGEEDSPTILRVEIDELERRRILEALEQSGGNQTQAARLLGISRRTLVTRLDAYEVARPRKGKR